MVCWCPHSTFGKTTICADVQDVYFLLLLKCFVFNDMINFTLNEYDDDDDDDDDDINFTRSEAIYQGSLGLRRSGLKVGCRIVKSVVIV